MKIKNRLIALYFSIDFLFTISIVIIFMFLFRKYHKKIRSIWAKLQLKIFRTKLEITGTPNSEAKMLVLNHQSIADIVIMEAVYPANLSWVAKKEIGDIPFFGHILDYPEMISINRSDKRSIIQLLKDAKDRLKKGRVIAIFPEGTRSNGKKILKFQDGAKILAEKLNLKIQPVVLVGTINIFDSKNFLANFEKVKLIYMDCVEPDKDKDWYKKMRDDMNQVFQKNLEEK